jgi:glycogen(starch) synthase
MTTDTVGGVWTFTKQLSSELLARGCSVALLSIGRAPSEAQTNALKGLANRWSHSFRSAWIPAPLEWMDDNARAYCDSAPALLSLACEFDADLILSSQFCFGALPFDGPKIVVAHSDVLSWAMACRGSALAPSQWLQQYQALTADGLAGADAVVAPTHWMLHALEKNFEIPGERHVIYNGRSISHASANAARRLQAVAAGRLWDEGKNLRLLASAPLSLPLLIAGESSQETPRAGQCSENPVFLGRLEEDQILSLFRQSSIYVCASKYEPFGLAPLEAALCGCAIVANDIPPLREVWGDAALFFSDEQSLSALLEKLSRSDHAMSSARRQAHWRALQFPAWRMAENYLELFRSMLSRGVRPYAA